MQITILEGARGTGKSTLAFKLRQRTPETTLINFTGFHTNDKAGLDKVVFYYNAWIEFFKKLNMHDSKFILDRFYFSEQVYSQLYKAYNFKENYKNLLNDLENLSEIGIDIEIIYLTINNEDELRKRLARDKIPFGKAEESVIETLKQQELYTKMFNAVKYNHTNKRLKIFEIDTSGKSNEEVYDEIIQLKTTKT